MRKIFAFVAVVLAVGCGGGNTTGPYTSVAGTYTLRTLNGSSLPHIVNQMGASMAEILDATLTLNEDGTFNESGHDRMTESGLATTTSFIDAGSISLRGTTITLVSSTTGTTNGSFNGDILTLSSAGLMAVYTK
jgi:hypothetical protein